MELPTRRTARREEDAAAAAENFIMTTDMVMSVGGRLGKSECYWREIMGITPSVCHITRLTHDDQQQEINELVLSRLHAVVGTPR